MLLYNPLSGRRRKQPPSGRRGSALSSAERWSRSLGRAHSRRIRRHRSNPASHRRRLRHRVRLRRRRHDSRRTPGIGRQQRRVGHYSAGHRQFAGARSASCRSLPAAAAQAALTAKPRRIAVGKIEYQDFAGNRATRYFTVTVGIGVDAHLFYKLDPLAKRRFGMAAYCAKATHLWLTHKMENFEVEITRRRPNAVSGSLAATRSPHPRFRRSPPPTCPRRIARPRRPSPGALPHSQPRGVSALRPARTLRHQLESPRNRTGPQHERGLPRSRIVRLGTNPRIFVEADGELLGTLPAEISVVRDAVTLLMPSR